MSFRFEPLALPGVVLVEPTVHHDERGWFAETYKSSAFARAGIPDRFVQENHSRSPRGIMRGLHFQRPPKAQGKLVRVVAGEVFDVAVDLRRRAPTFGRWVSAVLSAENRRLIYVPPWCAHGFCVISSEAEVLYKVTEEYAPDHEAGVLWNDPALGIAWPIRDPILAPRDQRWPPLQEAAVLDA